MRDSLFGFLGTGCFASGNGKKEAASLPWTDHPAFPGVTMKTIVTGDDTGGKLTCHFVRIEPGCAIGLHTHTDSLELHEVVAGKGVCATPEGDIPYTAGVMAIMPPNAPHEVRAGAEGLCLLAKFVTVTN